MKCDKCHLPGGSKNFHICLDLTAPLNISGSMQNVMFRANEKLRKTTHGLGRGAPGITKTAEQRRRMAEGQRQRWARIKAAG